MASGRDDEPVGGRDAEEWESPRSLFATTWFRVVVVVVVIGAVAAVSLPYLMDAVKPPPPSSPVVRAPAPLAEKPPAKKKDAAPPAPAPAPAVSAPAVSAPAVTAPAVASAPKAEAPAPKKAAAPAPRRDDKAAAETKAQRAPARRVTGAATAKAESGDYWVQVGAFRDPATAKRVAAGLRERGFTVAESKATPGETGRTAPGNAADRYDVVVRGAVPADAKAKLTAKGLSAETTGDGAVVRPSLALRDAVALSNDLRSEGFTVTVHRVGGGGGPAASTPSGGETLHRVRVGAFPDRVAARAASEKLQALGYTPFIARGRE